MINSDSTPTPGAISCGSVADGEATGFQTCYNEFG